MNKEEAIKAIQDFIGWFKPDSRIYKALKMAIQALSQELCEWGKMTFDAISGMSIFEFSDGTVKRVKQAELEPCEDAISRDAVIKIIEDAETARLRGDIDLLYAPILKKLNELTSVNPQPCDDAISRILKRMWNCRGKHTTSIDKVKMEQIIRDELSSVTQNPIECDDAISRQAVLDAMYKLCDTGGTLEENPWRDNPHIDAITDAVDDLPPVTPKAETVTEFADRCRECGARYGKLLEQKSGKWILLDECANSGYYCSNCQKKLVKEGWSDTVKKIKFCPNCGADMRGEK